VFCVPRWWWEFGGKRAAGVHAAQRPPSVALSHVRMNGALGLNARVSIVVLQRSVRRNRWSRSDSASAPAPSVRF
jgi:hypothetical protein